MNFQSFSDFVVNSNVKCQTNFAINAKVIWWNSKAFVIKCKIHFHKNVITKAFIIANLVWMIINHNCPGYFHTSRVTSRSSERLATRPEIECAIGCVSASRPPAEPGPPRSYWDPVHRRPRQKKRKRKVAGRGWDSSPNAERMRGSDIMIRTLSVRWRGDSLFLRARMRQIFIFCLLFTSRIQQTLYTKIVSVIVT